MYKDLYNAGSFFYVGFGLNILNSPYFSILNEYASLIKVSFFS